MATWSIDKITTVPQVGDHLEVVKEIEWRCTATSGEVTQSTYGKASLTLDESSFEDFTDYGDLTEAQVLNWVKSALGTASVAYQEELAQQRANAIANPQTKSSALPW